MAKGIKLTGSSIQVTGSTEIKIPSTSDGFTLNQETSAGSYPFIRSDATSLKLFPGTDGSGFSFHRIDINTSRIEAAASMGTFTIGASLPSFGTGMRLYPGANRSGILLDDESAGDFVVRGHPSTLNFFEVTSYSNSTFNLTSSGVFKVQNTDNSNPYINVSASSDIIKLSGSSIQMTGSVYASSSAGASKIYLNSSGFYKPFIGTSANQMEINAGSFGIYIRSQGGNRSSGRILNENWNIGSAADADHTLHVRGDTKITGSLFVDGDGGANQITGSTYFDDEVYIKTGASETPLTLQIGSSTNSVLKFQGNGSNTLKYSAGSGGGWYHSFLSNNTERFLIGDNYSAFRNSVQVTGSLNVSTNITASGTVSASIFYGDGSNLTGISAGGSGISSLSEDTTPQLGGNLDVNNFVITGSNIVARTSTEVFSASATQIDIGITDAAGTTDVYIGRSTSANPVIKIDASNDQTEISSGTNIIRVNNSGILNYPSGPGDWIQEYLQGSSTYWRVTDGTNDYLRVNKSADSGAGNCDSIIMSGSLVAITGSETKLVDSDGDVYFRTQEVNSGLGGIKYTQVGGNVSIVALMASNYIRTYGTMLLVDGASLDNSLNASSEYFRSVANDTTIYLGYSGPFRVTGSMAITGSANETLFSITSPSYLTASNSANSYPDEGHAIFEVSSSGHVKIQGLTVGIGPGSYDNPNPTFGGLDNTAFGYRVFNATQSGFGNSSGFGYRTLENMTSGFDNNAFGQFALNALTTGQKNAAFGNSALNTSTGDSRNSGFGHNALRYVNGGDDNTAIGYYAGVGSSGGTSTAISTGNNNTLIGVSTTGVKTADNQIAIGYEVTSSAANEMVIGNSSNTVLYNMGDATADLGKSTNRWGTAYVEHLTASHTLTVGGDGNLARIRLRRSDDAVVGEIFQNAGTTDIINNQGSGIRFMYQSTPLMHAKTTGVSLGYSQTNLHQVTGSMYISGATTGHLTASGHVSASAFYGDGSNLTGISAGGISDLVEDATPQLGGTLDVNGQGISGSTVAITGSEIRLRYNGYDYIKIGENSIGSSTTGIQISSNTSDGIRLRSYGASGNWLDLSGYTTTIAAFSATGIVSNLLYQDGTIFDVRSNASSTARYIEVKRGADTVRFSGSSIQMTGSLLGIYGGSTSKIHMNTNSGTGTHTLQFGDFHKIESNPGGGNLDLYAGYTGGGHYLRIYSDNTQVALFRKSYIALTSSNIQMTGSVYASSSGLTGHSFKVPDNGTTTNAFKVTMGSQDLIEARYHVAALRNAEAHNSLVLDRGSDSYLKGPASSNRGFITKVVGQWSAWGGNGSSIANAYGNAFRVIGYSPDTSNDFDYDYFRVSAALSGTIEANLSGSGYFNINNKEGDKTYLSISGSNDSIKLSGSIIQTTASSGLYVYDGSHEQQGKIVLGSAAYSYISGENSGDLVVHQMGSSSKKLYLGSAGDVVVALDTNNNDGTPGSSFSVVKDSLKSGTNIFSVREDGHTELTGSVDVSGSGYDKNFFRVQAGNGDWSGDLIKVYDESANPKIDLGGSATIEDLYNTETTLSITNTAQSIISLKENTTERALIDRNHSSNYLRIWEKEGFLRLRGNTGIQMTGSTQLSVSDNNASAFTVASNGHEYINIDTTNGNERILLKPNSGSSYPMLMLDNDYLQLYHSGYNHIYMFNNTMRIQGAPIQNQLYFSDAYWQIKGHYNATLEITRIDQDANFYHRLTPASSSIFSIEQWGSPHAKVGNYIAVSSSSDRVQFSGSTIEMTGSFKLNGSYRSTLGSNSDYVDSSKFAINRGNGGITVGTPGHGVTATGLGVVMDIRNDTTGTAYFQVDGRQDTNPSLYIDHTTDDSPVIKFSGSSTQMTGSLYITGSSGGIMSGSGNTLLRVQTAGTASSYLDPQRLILAEFKGAGAGTAGTLQGHGINFNCYNGVIYNIHGISIYRDFSTFELDIGARAPAAPAYANVQGYLQLQNLPSGGSSRLRFNDSGNATRWYMQLSDDTSTPDLGFYQSGLRGYLADGTNVSNIDFTGQHRSESDEDLSNSIGLIVVSTGEYSQPLESGSYGTNININEAIPKISLADTRNNKKVFGVISDTDESMSRVEEINEEGEEPKTVTRNIREYAVGSFISVVDRDEEDNRVVVNSLGEGGIWVCNINGNLENGDYITSCEIPGYGMKQDDDLLHNYTVAKITCDCSFDLNSTIYECVEFEFEGETYRKAFVGCTYHCG